MEELLLDIIAAIRKRGDAVPGDELADMILAHIKRTGAVRSECSKRRLLPFCLRLKQRGGAALGSRRRRSRSLSGRSA